MEGVRLKLAEGPYEGRRVYYNYFIGTLGFSEEMGSIKRSGIFLVAINDRTP